jgi:hypothetical protein
MEYNAAFFGTHEAYFLMLKEKFGEEKALEILRLVMERNLGKAYATMGFKKGDPHSFASAVGERDKSVGLRIEFPEISEGKIVYRFLTDPFPGLKGHVDPHKLDDTFMRFKVSFLLGPDWHYRTTKHIWKGDAFTEHIIEKK